MFQFLRVSIAAIVFGMFVSSCSDGTSPTFSAGTGEILSGNHQSGPAGQALVQPLRIQVLDHQGHPLVAIPIVFRITSGGGSISVSETTTDASGQASSVWTLGTVVTEHQQVSAQLISPSSDTIAIGTFDATPLPSGTQIAAVSGSGQHAVPSAPLPDSLLARVADQYGNPVANITVTWAVTAGGGTLTNTTTTSDAHGYVSTRWTLGSTAETQTVTATIAGEAPVAFIASTSTSQDITFASVSPSDNAVVGQTVSILVSLQSTYQLSTVTADVGAQHVALTRNSPNNWSGTLSLVGTPPGQTQLLLRATDSHNTTVIKSVPLVYDPAPILTVLAPADDMVVGSSSVAIKASCSDLNGSCTQLTVSASGQTLASGTSSIDATVSLSAYVGNVVPLAFTATDAGHQTTTVTRTIYVYADGHFTVIANVPGVVRDFDGSRVLYIDATNTLKIHAAGGSETTIYSGGGTIAGAKLIPSGAVFETQPLNGSGSFAINEYLNGTRTVVGDPRDGGWTVTGSYLLWVDPSQLLQLRNYATGTTTLIQANAHIYYVDGLAVSPTGDVAYANLDAPANVNIHFVPQGGSPVVLTSGGYSAGPLTDGTRVVYRTNAVGGYVQVMSWSAAGGTVALGSPIDLSGLQSSQYPLRNGWAAFLQPGVHYGSFTVWSSSPTLVTQAVGTFMNGNYVTQIGANGEMLFVGQSGLYLSVPPYSTDVLIGPAGVDMAVWQNGQFYIAKYGTLMRVQ